MTGASITFRRVFLIAGLIASCGGADTQRGARGSSGGAAGASSGAGGANGAKSGAAHGGGGNVGGGSSGSAGRAGARAHGGASATGGSSAALGGTSNELGGAGADAGAGAGEAGGAVAGTAGAANGGETSAQAGGAGETGAGNAGEGGARDGIIPGAACPAAWSLGAFVSHQTPDSGKGAFIADMNADGRADLVALTWGNAVVFLQSETGTLVQSGTYSISDGYYEPAGAVADFNGDGAADIIVASIHDVQLFLNDGNGAFGAGIVVSDAPPGPGISFNRMRVRDVDGDGALDASLLASPAVITYYGDGHGGIKRIGHTLDSPDSLRDFALLDITGDHRLDVVGLGSNLDVVATPQSALGFDQAWYTLTPYVLNLSPKSIETGDLDGDGRDDIVVSGDGNRPVTVKLLTAREGFATIHRLQSYDIPQTLGIADIDGNGTDDLLVLHGGWEKIGVYNRCQQGLESERLFDLPSASAYENNALAIGDLNSDGCLDVAVADYNYGVSVLLAQGCQR
jgi:hypothetical protein